MRRTPSGILLLAAALGLSAARHEHAPPFATATAPGEIEAPPPPGPGTAVFADVLGMLATARRAGEKLHVRLPDGRSAALTIDPLLQRRMETLLSDYEVPWGVVVAVEPATGRILALAQHSSAEPSRSRGLAARPMSPEASIFKIVTAAALLEEGVSPDERVCYHGGKRRIRPGHLQDSPRDAACLTMAEALGHSANVAFAKLAHRHLAPDDLRREAERLFFNAPVEVNGAPAGSSPAVIPDDPFAFASAAAGFSPEVRLTPLHAALMAATVGNGGKLVPLRLVDEVDGRPLPAAPTREVLAPERARQLARMMELTVSDGTARRAFRERRRPVLPVSVAGKTGSLDEHEPFRDHGWFVGFAPAEAPTIAVAVVIVNEPRWRLRAPWVAREALRSYLLGTSPYRPR
jgi:cell division protein FtsI/penicillin-binding protein 2